MHKVTNKTINILHQCNIWIKKSGARMNIHDLLTKKNEFMQRFILTCYKKVLYLI